MFIGGLSMFNLNTISKQHMLIYSMILSLAFPYYITTIYFFLLTIYILFIDRSFYINQLKYTKPISLFLTIITATSLLYQNWIGLLVSLILVCIFTLSFYFIEYSTKDVFEKCMNLLIIISIIWFVLSMFQYIQILKNNNIDHFIIKFFSRRENRINAVMMNANYYASTLEIVLLMIVYKFFNTSNIKNKILYGLVFIMNFFTLLLTSSRAGWIGLIGGLFIYFILNKNKLMASLFIVSALTLCIFLCFNIHLIPRIDYLLDNLSVRFNIFNTAIQGIMDKPLFGQGPMTYLMIFEQYNGHNTHHSHNILLEPLLSFGLIAAIPLIYFFKTILFNCIKIYKEHYKIIALIFSVFTTTLIHGMADFSIFFIQPGFIFLLIILSYVIFIKEQVH